MLDTAYREISAQLRRGILYVASTDLYSSQCKARLWILRDRLFEAGNPFERADILPDQG